MGSGMVALWWRNSGDVAAFPRISARLAQGSEARFVLLIAGKMAPGEPAV